VLPAAPIQIYDAFLDFDRYPEWGYPSYLFGRRDGELGVVGCKGTIIVQGALPYKITLNITVRRLIPAQEIASSVTGDVEGEVAWSLRPMGSGDTEVLMDWRCNLRGIVLRAFSPVCKPLFRWNHDVCKNAAMAGLSKYLGGKRE